MTGRSHVYKFRDAVNGFFEFPVDQARALLPAGLQPVEPHHGRAVLAVTAFDFYDSPVGEYREMIHSVLVAPRIVPGEPMPRAAMYPFRVATSTRAARQHAIELWHLPHLMSDVDVRFEHDAEKSVRITAAEGGRPILGLSITAYGGWQAVEHHYQTFAQDDGGGWFQFLVLQGPFMEHEEERGELALHDHPFQAGLVTSEVETTPFREQWMRMGVETLHPLQPLVPAGR